MVLENHLPDGWKWKSIGEANEVILGQSPSSDTYNTRGEGLPFFQGKAEFGDLYPTVVKWCSVPGKIAEPGDILISVRAPVGPTNLALEKSCIGRGLAALRPREGLITKYLLFYLRFIEKEWYKKATGTTFKAITGDVLRQEIIPIAPVFEQEWIVEKIEELFTQLDAGVAALKHVQAGLKRYKASVLKAACEGRLVPHDPSDEPAEELLRRFSKSALVHKDLISLPPNWSWVTWETILANEKGAFRRGPFGSALKKSIFVNSGYKVYEQYCPINDDCSFGRYFITEQLFEKLKSFEVKPGDYLISCSGVSLGRITQVPENAEKGIINQALLRVRLNKKIIDDKYFLNYFRSPFFQKQLFDTSTGTAIPNVKGVGDLKALPIPLPPISEQKRIVEELEHRFSDVNNIMDIISANFQRASRLRQAILQRAFEGKLVSSKTSIQHEQNLQTQVSEINTTANRLVAKQERLL